MTSRCLTPGSPPLRAALAVLLLSVGVASSSSAQDATPTREWDRPSPYPDRVVLTWSDSPATTQSVTWRTDTTVAMSMAQVVIATDGPRMVDIARTDTASTERHDGREVPSAGGVAHYHSVTFAGLRPDTLYAYRVGDGTRWTEWFQFRTASTQQKPFSFLYLGDAQNDVLSLWSRVIREGFRKAPDMRFIIHAGDLVNNGNSDGEWGEWFRAGGFIHAMVPSMPAAGNHEYRARSAEEAARNERSLSVFWKPQFTLPQNGVAGLEESNYWFDYQGARILVLNSNADQQAQVAWMRSVITTNPQPWVIATFHHPIFSSATERDNANLRAAWKPVFDEFGVDLVLQGHDHTYARGRDISPGATGVAGAPIAAGGVGAGGDGTAAERNVATGVNTRAVDGGPVYVVSVSGAKMYEAKDGGWERYDATLERRAENTQLFQVIHIDGDTLRYEAMTATGSLYDAFELIRDGARNRFVERMPTTVPPRTMQSAPAYRRP